MSQHATSRRRLLQLSSAAGALSLIGCGAAPSPRRRFVETVELLSTGIAELDTAIGAGLDGRLYTDLSRVTGAPAPPTETFFVRTRRPEHLPPRDGWTLSVAGLGTAPLVLHVDDLLQRAVPMETHVMECSGNGDFAQFGMLGSADWSGVALAPLLDRLDASRNAPRVLVGGFDDRTSVSETSTPGASWIFSRDDLVRSGAFLATAMNGAPLTEDHGAPVRLVVPGWYGCASIKWVNTIALLDDGAEATAHMKEFASRTHQHGVPDLAKDYRPATMDLAAMAVRVERWRIDGAASYRVVGLAWGGDRATAALTIRFEPELVTRPCFAHARPSRGAWTVWTHAWRPRAPGPYKICVRTTDPDIRARRLEAGHYDRSVHVDEV